MFVEFFICFHSFVYQRLSLCLKEKHLDVLLSFLCKDIIPLGYAVIIAESLSIFTIQFLTLLLFFFL